MNKLLYIFFCILLSVSLVKAENIEEVEIDGIRIGDTLLQYMSKEKIFDEKKISAEGYKSLGKQIFFEAYMVSTSDKYDQISVFVKSNDANYKIYAIYASIIYHNNINDDCYNVLDKYTKMYDIKYNNLKKKNKKNKIAYDTTGRSILTRNMYFFENGDAINLECYDFHESYQKDHGYKNPDAFNIALIKKELYEWLY